MDDLISRQALLAEYDRLHVGEPGRARKLIEDAPSVTITGHTNALKVTNCNDNDLVSRQTAIDALKNQMSDRNDLYNIPVRRSIVILEQLPSAQPERKTGKWTIYDRHTMLYQYICSECGAYHRAMYDFCPTCGAEMRGETDGR